MHAQIVLFDGFDPLDVIAPLSISTPIGKIKAVTEHRP